MRLVGKAGWLGERRDEGELSIGLFAPIFVPHTRECNWRLCLALFHTRSQTSSPRNRLQQAPLHSAFRSGSSSLQLQLQLRPSFQRRSSNLELCVLRARRTTRQRACQSALATSPFPASQPVSLAHSLFPPLQAGASTQSGSLTLSERVSEQCVQQACSRCCTCLRDEMMVELRELEWKRTLVEVNADFAHLSGWRG